MGGSPRRRPDASSEATLEQRRQPWSVTVGQWLGVLVAVLFAGPLFLSNLWGYLETRRYLSELTTKTARNIASAEAGRVQVFIQDAEGLAPALERGTPELAALLITATDGPEDSAAAARGKLHGLLRVVGATVNDLSEIQLLAPTGRVIASSLSAELTAPNIVTALCLQRARAGASVVAFEPGDGTHELLIAAPLASGHVFCARFDGAVFPRLLAGLESEPEDADRYLLDETRAPIASVLHPEARGPELRIGDLLRGQPDAPWAASMTTPDRQALAIAYHPLKSPAWGVVVTIPGSSNLVELEGLKRQAVIVFLSLTAVVALAMFMAWRTLVGPLRALATTAERIAGGAIGATVAPAGPREVVELTSTFNRMSLALRESQQTLEEKIEARTRELRESEEFLEHLLNSIDQRVVVTDRDFRIQKANNAADRMHGQSLLGARCYEVFEGRTSPCEQCPVAATFDSGAGATAERSQQTAAGRELFAIETYPVRGRQGNVDSVIAISRVISDEKQLQAKLAFQEKMAAFGQLAAGVAHELGNPLASIDAQLQRAEGDPARATTSLPIVRKEVGRMSRMLRELVDLPAESGAISGSPWSTRSSKTSSACSSTIPGPATSRSCESSLLGCRGSGWWKITWSRCCSTLGSTRSTPSPRAAGSASRPPPSAPASSCAFGTPGRGSRARRWRASSRPFTPPRLRAEGRALGSSSRAGSWRAWGVSSSWRRRARVVRASSSGSRSRRDRRRLHDDPNLSG